jgi:hypothetical protein
MCRRAGPRVMAPVPRASDQSPDRGSWPQSPEPVTRARTEGHVQGVTVCQSPDRGSCAGEPGPRVAQSPDRGSCAEGHVPPRSPRARAEGHGPGPAQGPAGPGPQQGPDRGSCAAPELGPRVMWTPQSPDRGSWDTRARTECQVQSPSRGAHGRGSRGRGSCGRG